MTGSTAGPDVGDADIDVDHIETIPPDLGDIERGRAGHRSGVWKFGQAPG